MIKAIWRDLLRQVLSRSKSGPDLGTSFGAMSPRTPNYGRRRSPIAGSQSYSPDTQSKHLVELALVDCLARLGQRFAADSSGFGSTRAQLFFPLGKQQSRTFISRPVVCAVWPNRIEGIQRNRGLPRVASEFDLES